MIFISEIGLSVGNSGRKCFVLTDGFCQIHPIPFSKVKRRQQLQLTTKQIPDISRAGSIRLHNRTHCSFAY